MFRLDYLLIAGYSLLQVKSKNKMTVKKPNPQNFTDIGKLQGLLKNAVRLGEDEIAWGCRERIAELQGSNYMDKLDKEFWHAVSIAEQIRTEEAGRTVQLSRTRQKYPRDGAKETIRSLAVKSKFADGFKILERGKHLYLSFEAVVIRNADCFEESDVEQVKEKMRNAGYPDDFWMMPIR